MVCPKMIQTQSFSGHYKSWQRKTHGCKWICVCKHPLVGEIQFYLLYQHKYVLSIGSCLLHLGGVAPHTLSKNCDLPKITLK